MVDGAARLGFLHYNTEAEIDQCLEALEAVCK
jgi:selenocysteine lyase/cysteine desulfurase